jgi:hypothetical protein
MENGHWVLECAADECCVTSSSNVSGKEEGCGEGGKGVFLLVRTLISVLPIIMTP